jgi:hypothetical protein
MPSETCARIISNILNPLVLPLFVIGFVAVISTPNLVSELKIFTLSTVLFAGIPLVAVVLILSGSKHSSIDFDARSSRHWLYLSSILSYGVGGLVVFADLFSGMFRVIIVVYTLNLIVAFLLNLRWKVSVHSGSLFSTAILFLWIGMRFEFHPWALFFGAFLLISSPLVFWSRRKLKVHSLTELFLGAFTGLVISIVGIWLFG